MSSIESQKVFLSFLRKSHFKDIREVKCLIKRHTSPNWTPPGVAQMIKSLQV